MCEVCGCGDTEHVSLEVHQSLLSDNDARAAHLRAHFREDGVTAINLMGSPGAGKTALLEATARALGARRRLVAVSGDLATTNDGERLARAGIPAETITTGSACHLEAKMIEHVLHGESLGPSIAASDFFFIENVGNLVCPAIYDLGQTANVVALSITEGVDKPLKYPVMFRHADLVVVTKMDLLPHLPGVSLDALRDALSRVMPAPQAIYLSTVDEQGMAAWVSWLLSLREKSLRSRPSEHRHVHPRP